MPIRLPTQLSTKISIRPVFLLQIILITLGVHTRSKPESVSGDTWSINSFMSVITARVHMTGLYIRTMKVGDLVRFSQDLLETRPISIKTGAT